MKFHNITDCDMLNGDGLRTVLWVSGCEIGCKGCQNANTWDPEVGVEFDDAAKEELFGYLSKDYIQGLTLSGGHPLHPKNIDTIQELVREVKTKFPDKDIWLYTGLTIDNIIINAFIDNSLKDVYRKMLDILVHVDVVVDGPFIERCKDDNYKWAGSTNQRVIDMKTTISLVSLHIDDIIHDSFIESQKKLIDSLTILHTR